MHAPWKEDEQPIVERGKSVVSDTIAAHRSTLSSDAHRTIWLGLTLAAVGGFLDAFTYVGKGHVFANAMSGNVVITALALQAGDWSGAGRALSAIAAFIVGVMVANTLRLPRVSRVVRQPHMTALVVEMTLLVMIGAAPHGVSDTVIVLGVTFVAAVQTSTFRLLADWTFTSTMSTGNLRSLVDAIVDWTTNRQHVDARKIAHFGAVCLAFFAGAIIGGMTTIYWGDRAAWVVAVLVAVCIIIMALRMWRKLPPLSLRPRAEIPFPRLRSLPGRRPQAGAHAFSKGGGTMRGVAAATSDSSQEESS
jgi:uncharacterized membrane protein YoaK (UPF0700 family)